MSYSACSNSAILKQDAYPVGAIGSIIAPTLNTNPVASAALLQPVAAQILPEGVWLVSATLNVDSTNGAETLTGFSSVAVDSATRCRVFQNVASNGVTCVLSAVVESDGTASVTLPMTYTGSGGSTYALQAAPLSLVQFTRIA